MPTRKPKEPEPDENYSEEETVRRRDEALLRALRTPPQPRKGKEGKMLNTPPKPHKSGDHRTDDGWSKRRPQKRERSS